MKQQTLPIIAIVGRPNVGKSSLFNRLIHQRYAITSDIAGTTRDRIYYKTNIDGIDMILIDTGGLEYGKKDNIETDVASQVHVAIEEADIILFLVDAKEGLTIEDHEAAKLLRRSKKDILFVANKIDNKTASDNIFELQTLGFSEPVEISAYHNKNIAELETRLVEELNKQGFIAQENPLSPTDKKINICFVGKPNSGKSSLVNAILGKNKVIVSDTAGTTRDATDTEFKWEENDYNLIDTAGLRRRGKIERGLEKISSFRALSAIERCDVACLVLDYSEGIRKQDLHITSYIQDAGKGLILLINKSDLMEEKESEQNKIIRQLRRKFDFLPWAPAVFVSALNKTNITKILETSKEIYDERKKEIDQDTLIGFMRDVIVKHLPPAMSARLPKFYNLDQVGIDPPSFAFSVADPRIIHFSYKRYLENEMRKKFGFNGTSINIYFDKKIPKKAKRRR